MPNPLRPRALRPGARIHLAAPSGPVPADRLEAGILALRAALGPLAGEFSLAPNLAAHAGYFAGDDDTPLCRDLWFDSWGLGLSAQILAKRNREREIVKRIPLVRQIYRDKLVYIRAGLSSYLKNVVKSLFGRARFAAQIRIDDRTVDYDGVNDIVVKGTLLYGGDWIFAPEGKPDDGKFEVIIVKNNTDWGAAAIGAHKRNPVTRDDLAVLGLPRREIPSGRVVDSSAAGAMPRSRAMRPIW